jgi:aminopeptidase N
MVTLEWWNNLWLNEGFATWMENKPVAAWHPEWNIPQDVATDLNSTLNLDAQRTTRTIRAKAETPDEINEMFDGITYGKAGAMLLMVENYEGEETFRKGVHNYLSAHMYGNATAEDFWNAQTAVSHKPVDKIMESLVAEPGAPILEFGPPAAGQVPVAQSRFFLSPGITPDPQQKWTLPVCFKADAKKQDCEVLIPSSASLAAPAGKVFFTNAGGKGYYRSAYASAQYAALVAEVETGLTPEERISLTGDEWAQVRADKATVGDYLDLVSALSSDPSSDVLSNAVDNVSAIADRVASTKEERDALAAWIRRTFAPVYAQLGKMRICGPRRAASRINIWPIRLRSVPLSARPRSASLRRMGTQRSSTSCKRSTRPRATPSCRTSRCASLYSSPIPSSWSGASNIPFPPRCAIRIRSISSTSRCASRKTETRPGSSSRRIGVRCRRNSQLRWARILSTARAAFAPSTRVTT